MRIELFCLCDYASNEDGHLTVVRTLDEIVIDKEPWRAYFGFALKGLVINPQPVNTKIHLSIRKVIESPDPEEAEKLTETTQPVFETSAPLGDKTGKFVAAGNLRGIIFNTPGSYRFRISIEERVIEDYYFKVTLAKTQNND